MYGAQGVGALKEVLVHCPGDELDILEPVNLKEYLFDALVDKDEAIDEHREFVTSLEGLGVKVHQLVDVIGQSRSVDFTGAMTDVIKRLPNMFFMRDLAVITADGAIIASMRFPARSVEPVVVKSVLAGLGIKILCDIKPPATLEGGDILFLDKDTMLVGAGERTDDDGFYEVKKVWLKDGRTLAKIPITAFRGSMHLDTVLGIISGTCVVVHADSIGDVTSFEMQSGQTIENHAPVKAFFSSRGYDVIEVTSAEQYNMACNTLMIEPGKRLLCYHRGFKASLPNLASRGVELTGLHLPQLFIGGGGPHCMTLELKREAA